MIVEKTKLEDCFLIKPKIFEDERGYFYECFNQEKLLEAVGQKFEFIQDNEAKSSFGVLRGLHFQVPPHSQA